MNETKTTDETKTFREINRDELRKKVERGDKFHLWDARTEQYFSGEVIQGAKWVPADQLEKKLPALGAEKSDEIVVYCSSVTCPASKSEAKQLSQLGFSNVSVYESGLADWKEAGLPTQKAA